MRRVDIRTPLTVCGLKVSTVLFWHSSWMDMDGYVIRFDGQCHVRVFRRNGII